MRPIEERLRDLVRGEPLPANTRDFATVMVPVGWLMEAVGVIEQYRREDDEHDEHECRTLPSNLWY